jgi:hypothetical protein
MSKFADEPWSNGIVIIDGDPVTAVQDSYGDEICNMGNSLLDEEANARRIVACVNACRHLSTEQIEAGDLDYAGCSTLADIRAALGVGDKPMLGELAGIVETMKLERDEAVEALRAYSTGTLPVYGALKIEGGWRLVIIGIQKHARAVLAKIEGGKS